MDCDIEKTTDIKIVIYHCAQNCMIGRSRDGWTRKLVVLGSFKFYYEK